MCSLLVISHNFHSFSSIFSKENCFSGMDGPRSAEQDDHRRNRISKTNGKESREILNKQWKFEKIARWDLKKPNCLLNSISELIANFAIRLNLFNFALCNSELFKSMWAVIKWFIAINNILIIIRFRHFKSVEKLR